MKVFTPTDYLFFSCKFNCTNYGKEKNFFLKTKLYQMITSITIIAFRPLYLLSFSCKVIYSTSSPSLFDKDNNIIKYLLNC